MLLFTFGLEVLKCDAGATITRRETSLDKTGLILEKCLTVRILLKWLISIDELIFFQLCSQNKDLLLHMIIIQV